MPVSLFGCPPVITVVNKRKVKFLADYVVVVLYNYGIICDKFYRRSNKQFRNVYIAHRPTKIISKDAENLGGCEFEAHLIK